MHIAFSSVFPFFSYSDLDLFLLFWVDSIIFVCAFLYLCGVFASLGVYYKLSCWLG